MSLEGERIQEIKQLAYLAPVYVLVNRKGEALREACMGGLRSKVSKCGSVGAGIAPRRRVSAGLAMASRPGSSPEGEDFRENRMVGFSGITASVVWAR